MSIERNTGRKILLRLGYSCNNECVFCHSRDRRFKNADQGTDLITLRIEAAAEAGVDMVVFSGGEPTIRKDLFELCARAQSVGLEVGLITNGRMLYYKDYAERLYENV
ncbi:MAG: radical SAM protein, partial [Victivallales bacterium]|nr:radical SAM protein [Victivallales bacterium]